MALELNGTTGVSAVQAGSIQSNDLAAGVGGKVLQTVSKFITSANFIASTSYVSVGLSESISVSSASNKVLVFCSGTARNDGDSSGDAKDLSLAVFRNDVEIQETFYFNDFDLNGINYTASFCFEDSPSTTGTVNYEVKVSGPTRGDVRFPVSLGGGSPYAQLIIMEIAG